MTARNVMKVRVHSVSVEETEQTGGFGVASQESAALRQMISGSGMWNKALKEIRQALEVGSVRVAMPQDVTVVTARAGNVPVEWLVPVGADEGKAMVYFHGGGYCLGVYDANRSFVAELAKMCGVKALLVDYRLAPENPFPAAIEDVLAAYRWLLSSGVRPEDTVFVGDSSGCGLALVAMTILRENGEPLPAAMVSLTPMVDLTHSGESMRTRAAVDPFQLNQEHFVVNHYIQSLDASSPLLTPLRADLAGLPPMFIHAGDYDVFLSDAVSLAEQAQRSGVAVTLKVWDEMWHIFHMYAAYLPEGREALAEVEAFIRGSLRTV